MLYSYSMQIPVKHAKVAAADLQEMSSWQLLICRKGIIYDTET